MKISLLCADETYRRMLELELSAYGAVCDSELPTDETPPADYALLDVCSLSRFGAFPKKFYVSTPSLIFGFPDELSTVPPEIYTLFEICARPMLISELLKRVFGVVHEAFTHGSEVKRVASPADKLLIINGNRTVFFRGEPVTLSIREHGLLSFLAENRGRELSRGEILGAVWGETGCENEKVVDVYVRYLREKLDERFGVKLIKSVRGVGYTIPTEIK